MDNSNQKNDIRFRKRGRGKIRIIKRNRVDNNELKAELIKFTKSKNVSERLGELFVDLVDNLATKNNFSGYSFLEEMKSEAILHLLKYSKAYDPKKSNYAFTYCSQIASRAFIQIIKKEKKRAKSKKEFIEKILRDKNFFTNDSAVIP